MKGIWKKYWKVLVGGLWLSTVIALSVWITIFTPENAPTNSSPEFLRGIGLFLLGAGVAPLGLFLAYNRTESLKSQSETDKEKAVTEKEKAVTEAFAKSVELLGNDREAARQGGVYALGRLADDNSDYHPMIMDIVASYIRQESRRWFFNEKDKRGKSQTKPVSNNELVDELRLEPMPMDIEAAVAVIRERNTAHDDKPKEGQYLLDLSNAYIFNANFIHTSLKKVNFSDSVMVNCTFNDIDLSESNFVEANLNGSTVVASNLKGARITQQQVDLLKEIDEKTVLPEGLSLPAR